MRTFSLSLVLATTLLGTFSTGAMAQTGEEAKPVFLVTDVVVADGVDLDKDAARDALATRFGRLKDKLEVRSMAEAKASMNTAALNQLLGTGSDADLEQVQNYVQVDRLVFGRVSLVGGIVDLQVKVFNVKEGVVEVGFARRLGKDADRAVILALLDTLADNLLAWTIETYTDGEMSAGAKKMAAKKLTKKPPAPPVVETSPWSALGVAGGTGLGLGVGAAAVGAVGAFGDGDISTTDIVIMGAGAGVAVLGAVIVVIDGVTE